MENAIELRNVKKSFSGSPVLQGVDFQVPRSKITVLLGFSGSGKSTIMKIIIGLLTADSGEVTVFGRQRSKMGPKDIQAMRTRFGMLFQESALFDDMSVYENVAFPLREHRRNLSESKIKAIVEEKLNQVGLYEGFDKLPSQLSGGMKKRVALARAIALDPEVLLYDEPTTGLDPVMTEMVNDLIVQTGRSGSRTSVVISHDISSTVKIADQIVFLDEGKIILAGASEEFLKSEHPLIKRFFNH